MRTTQPRPFVLNGRRIPLLIPLSLLSLAGVGFHYAVGGYNAIVLAACRGLDFRDGLTTTESLGAARRALRERTLSALVPAGLLPSH